MCISTIVFAVATAPNGTLIAFVCRFANAGWIKKLPPVYLLSRDHGETWSEPRPLAPELTVEDVSLTFDAVFTHDDKVFAVFMGGPANYCDGPHSFFVSADNGETFQRRSILPFDLRDYYVTAGVLDSGDIIVYSYPYRADEDIDEYNIPYVTSADQGRTWSEVEDHPLRAGHTQSAAVAKDRQSLLSAWTLRQSQSRPKTSGALLVSRWDTLGRRQDPASQGPRRGRGRRILGQ